MKVGDYVRTETGQIGKITYFERDMVRVDTDKFITYKSNHNEITKISPNIIDLIEVGDYVNGNRVIEIDNKSKDIFNKYLLVEETDYDNYNISYSNNDIKSIVTKEMYSSVEYRVEIN